MFALLAACCPTFEETRVIGTGGEAEILQDALDTFAGWTSREGVCVASIEASVVTHDDAAGTFDGTHIQVATDQLSREVVFHELCHAWDAAEGRPSHDLPDLFSADMVTDEAHYPTDALKVQEAFADACMGGPSSRAQDNFYADLCGVVPEEDPTEAWLLEHVYDTFEDTLGADYKVGGTQVTRRPLYTLPPGERIVSVAVAGTSIVLLREVTSQDGTRTTSLDRVDPLTATVTDRWELPEGVDPDWQGLLGSSAEPILWSGGSAPMRAWRYVDGTPVPLALPEMGDPVGLNGYVWGDTAWLVPWDMYGYSHPLAVDLATGATDTLPMDTGDPASPAVFVGAGDRVATNVGSTVEVWSIPDRTPLVTGHLPSWTPQLFTPLPDGRVVTVLTAAAFGDRGGGLPAIVDVAAETWNFPESDCTDVEPWSSVTPLVIGADVYAVVGTDDKVELATVEY